MTNEQDYIKLGKAQDDISSVTNTIKDKKLLTVLTTHNGTEIKSTELELPTGDTVTKVSGSVSVDDKLTITVATDKGDKTTGPITLPVSKQYAKMKFSGEEATASALLLKKIIVGADEWKITVNNIQEDALSTEVQQKLHTITVKDNEDGTKNLIIDEIVK